MGCEATDLDGRVDGAADPESKHDDAFEDVPDSRRRPTLPPGQLRLSEAMWGIRWAEFLPIQVTQDVTAVVSSFDQAKPFIEAHYEAIFEDDGAGRFHRSPRAAALTRYYRVAGDFFEFKLLNRTVALLIGTPADWSTYYIRSAAALPEVQGKKVIQRFFPEMFAVLKAAGVERVEAETSPSNMATLHLLSRLRFNPSGTVLTDRWGAMLKFTRFLDEAAERVFLDQFCVGVCYQRRGRQDSGAGPKEGVST